LCRCRDRVCAVPRQEGCVSGAPHPQV